MYDIFTKKKKQTHPKKRSEKQWLKEISPSDTSYIQVQVYDKLDEKDGLWGQVCAPHVGRRLQIQLGHAPHTH